MGEQERFYGYCFPEPGGWHTPSVTLNTPEEIFHYTQLHGRTGMFREVRITDSDDYMVVQMIDGKYTWPEEWEQLNKGETGNEAGEAADEETENHDCSSKGAGAGELVGGTGNGDTACVDSSEIRQAEDDQQGCLMSGRNYWHVYNWLRRNYIATGAVAERMDLLEEFAELESGEIDEGIAEFELAIGKRKREVVPDGKEHTQAN